MLLLSLALLTSQLAPDHQLLKFELPGVYADRNGRFAAGIARFPDQDGDGAADLLMRSPQNKSVQVRSSRTGAILLEANTPDPQGIFGERVQPAGDVDGDGRPDFFASYYPLVGTTHGSLRGQIRSGFDGSVIRDITAPAELVGQVYFSSFSDINGDGKAEYLIGLPDEVIYFAGGVLHTGHGVEEGRAELHDGATGASLLRIKNPFGYAFGALVLELGDLDGDGYHDIGVGGALLDGAPGQGGVGFFAFSSADGSKLWTTPVTPRSCVRVNDLDGDGIDDLAIDGRAQSTQPRSHSTLHMVAALSGATGAPIWNHTAPYSDRYGSSLAAGDFNGDGLMDIVVGAHQTFGCTASYGSSHCDHEDGYVEILDGATGRAILRIDGEGREDGLGSGVFVLGDTNHDGILDLAATSVDGGSVIQLRVLSSKPVALKSDIFEISASQGGQQRFDLDMGPSHAGELAVLIGTASGILPGTTINGQFLPINLDAYTSLELAQHYMVSLSGTGRGAVDIALQAGISPSLVGTTLFHAFLVLDPATLVATGASWAVPTTLIP